MTDIQRKTAVIQSIESLQLGQHLIVALDDRETAECVAIAVQSLQGLTEHWELKQTIAVRCYGDASSFPEYNKNYLAYFSER